MGTQKVPAAAAAGCARSVVECFSGVQVWQLAICRACNLQLVLFVLFKMISIWVVDFNCRLAMLVALGGAPNLVSGLAPIVTSGSSSQPEIWASARQGVGWISQRLGEPQ